MKFKVLDLFSGIGGFSLGLERTGGFETVAFCEIDSFCRKVLRKHWPDVRIHKDICKLKSESYKNVDVICGGFPCQDISLSNIDAQGLEGARSGLWYEYLRLIREIRPKYVIVENVAALLIRGLSSVLGGLAESGYDAEWDCLSASMFGAPHRRDRIFIIAYTDNRTALPTMEIGQAIDAETATKKAVLPLRFVNDIRPKGWVSESGFRRVDVGASARMDEYKHRARALGNCVVPQIAEWLGKRIMEHDKCDGLS